MIRNRAPFPLALALLFALGACGGTDQTPAVERTTADAAKVDAGTPDLGGPEVELTDPGSEPRESIRIAMQAGDTQSASITLRMSMRMTVDGKSYADTEVPPMVMGMRLEVTDVEDGVIRADFGYDDVLVRGSGPDAEAVEEALRPLADMTGTMEVTDNGRLIDASLDIPDDLDPNVRNMVGSIESQLQNLTTPFPEEEVGVGATWTVTAQSAVGGINARIVTRYELVERTADGLVLSMRMDQSAPEQDADIPGLPAGSTVHVDRMETTGTGRLVYEPGMLIPSSSRSDLEGSTEMTVEENGGTSSLEQSMRMRMVLAGR